MMDERSREDRLARTRKPCHADTQHAVIGIARSPAEMLERVDGGADRCWRQQGSTRFETVVGNVDQFDAKRIADGRAASLSRSCHTPQALLARALQGNGDAAEDDRAGADKDP